MEKIVPEFIVATLIVVAVYFANAAFVTRPLDGERPREFSLDPIKITADPFRRGSLANFQVFFFSLVVIWLAVFWILVEEGKLAGFHESVLYLLGITAIGAGGAKIAETMRMRLSFENWAWLKKKKWIEKDITASSVDRKPRWGDLVMSEQGFEVAQFQALAFTLVVGLSLIVRGVTDAFQDVEKIAVPGIYLGIMGLSQAVFIGGKAIGAPTIAELDAKISMVRELESAFMNAVAQTSDWRNATPAQRNHALAKSLASIEFVKYDAAVQEAAQMVMSCIVGDVHVDKLKPDLPDA